jgi:hypothetical protein
MGSKSARRVCDARSDAENYRPGTVHVEKPTVGLSADALRRGSSGLTLGGIGHVDDRSGAEVAVSMNQNVSGNCRDRGCRADVLSELRVG